MLKELITEDDDVIIELLQIYTDGLTTSQIIKQTNYTKYKVLAILNKLNGANLVTSMIVGKAFLHKIK